MIPPETCLFISVLAYFTTIATNRFLGERNYARLTPENRMRLTDAFAKHRSLATYIPIAIMLMTIAVGYTKPQAMSLAFPVGIVLVLIVSVALQIAIFRRLTELSLPDDYVSGFRVQSILVQIGNAVALSMFGYGIAARLT